MAYRRVATQGLTADAFPLPPVRVFSGHYHNPHSVPEPAAKGRAIRYVGSPYQTSMSEAGQRKALLVVDSARGWRVAEEVPLSIGRRHHVLSQPGRSERHRPRDMRPSLLSRTPGQLASASMPPPLLHPLRSHRHDRRRAQPGARRHTCTGTRPVASSTRPRHVPQVGARGPRREPAVW